MLRDTSSGGASYKVGFGAGNVGYRDPNDQEGPSPKSGFINKALYGHPVMRFFTLATGTMVGMHFAGKMVQRGGMKLGTQLFENDFGKDWQKRLLKDYRDVQRTLDTWERGIHRTPHPDHPDNPLKDIITRDVSAGFYHDYETRRRAAIIGDVLPHEEWTFRDELKQRLIRQARRLPYDLPAAWIAQRAVVDPITGQRDNEPRWSSPMSVIGNFANTSAKNLLGLLLPFQAAGAGLSQGWRRAMTFGDTAVPKTGFERFGRHASLSLDAMLRQVGQDASQMLYNMSKLSAKSTGALGAGINEAIDQNKHIVDHLHQARRSSFPNSLSPEMGGGGERDMKVAALATSRWVASRFLNRLPFQSLYRGATDYWHEFDYRMMHREAWLRGEQEFTFAGAKERTFQFRGKPLQYPTPGGWKDVRLGSSERIFNSGGERITLVPGQRIHTDSNLAYFPHAERTEAERIAGSLYGLQGAGPGSRSWFKGDFYRGVVRTEYSKLAEKELADGITRARTAGKGLAPADITKISDEAQTAARAFMQRTNIGYLPGRELSKTPIQEAINRIKFGEGVSYKFEKPRTEWEADLYGRLKNVPVPEIQSHANYIAGEITGAVRRADELFIDQRETINARIEHQWKRLYSEALVPAVRSNFDLRPSRLARGAFIGESLDEESYDFLLRKTAITAGFELKRNTEQEAVRQMLQSRGFDPTNVGQLRAFLTHKGVLSPPWSGRGFNALGLRALSIEKALDTRFFSQRHVGEIRRLVTSISKTDPLDVRRTAVGSGVFETASGQILDLSPLYSAGRRLLNAASTKLQLPILRFNPLQMLGYGANRELAEGDPIQYLPGKSRQIFVGEGGGDNDAFLWIRQHRARGRLFKINTDTAEVAGKSFFNSDVKQVGDSLVSLYPTERWGMLGRSVRLAAGEKGLSPRKTPSRLGRMFDLDSDQPASGLDKVRRFRNRKDDLDYFATFARKLHEGFPEYANKRDMPQMGSRVAHGLDLFDQYLRRFTMPQPLIRSLEGEVQGTSLENLFRFSSGKSVSSIRHIEDLERATREQLAADADAVSLGESKVALSRAQSTIWRHLNKADSQRYFTKGTGFTFQKAGISTRADQFRADIYRYLAMRQHIIDVEAGVGEDPITELMNKLASMRGRGLMSQKDYSVARAAVANYQMSFLSQRYWSLHATDQERLLRVFEDLRVDSRFKELWKAVSQHHLAPDMPLRDVRKWLKGTFGLGYSDYEYPGTVYNPFGSRVVAVNRPGTLFRRDARRFLRHVGGDKTWSDPEFFSGASVPVSHFFQRLNRFWSMFGLQIDEQPYRGPLSFYGIGMTGKRILPIYAAGATGIMLDRELGGQLNPRDQNEQKVYSPYVLGHLAAIPAYGEVLAAGVTGGRQGMQDKYQQIFQGEVPIRRGRFWSLGNCIVPTQLIQTGPGQYKEAQDIEVGDFVITHEGVLKPVLNIVTRDMNEGEWTPAIQLHSIPFSNVTTDNHPYLVVKKKHCPAYTSYVDCRPDRLGTQCQNRQYKACYDQPNWKAEWIQAKDLEVGDYLAYPRIKIQDNIKAEFGLPFNRDIGYLYGIYLAEGNRHSVGEDGRIYGIELNIHKNEDHIADKVTRICKEYFDLEVYDHFTDGNARKLRVFSVQLGEFFRRLYPNDDKVFFPNIYNYSEEFVIGLLSGLFDGDGGFQFTGKYHNSLKLDYSSSRLEYILQVRNLLFTLGFPCSVTERHEFFDWDNDGVKEEYFGWRLFVTGDAAKDLNRLLDLYKTDDLAISNCWNVSKYMVFDEDFVYIKIKSIIDNGYRGLVYDFEIEDSHSFCSISTVMHNTPYFGSRVMYYRPSWYRRLRSGYKYTQEDWHTPLQQWLYGYDFSPLRVLNPYKWEQMHYQDRPYPVTGEYFTGPWGPMTSALNLTIGRILKPPRMMHRDDMQAGLAAYSPIGQYGVMSPSPAKDRSNFLLRQTSGGQFGVFIPRTGADYIGRGAEGTRLIPMGGMGNGSGRHARAVLGQLNEYYVTNAGSPAINSSYNPPVTVVPSPTTQDETRRSMVNAHQIILLTQPRIMGPRVLPNAPVLAQSGFQNTLAQYGYEQQELWGIYGFAFGAVREASGVSNQNFSTTRPVLESASRAYGSERAFWDLNLGGLGDIPSVGSENIEISEIVRRFIPHRRRELNTINPIPNTYINQYPWLPHGGDYFQDYGLGDPFCLSGSSLVEVGDLDFIRADEVKLHDQLVDTFGDATTVNRLAIRNPEPLFRLTFATLPAWPIECTPDHPIVTRTLVKGRDNKVRVKLYKDANMLLKEVQNGGTRCDMADRAGLRYGRATAAWTLLEKHHKVNIIRNGQRGIVEVLDAEPFDEELLDKGLLFVRADELKVGDYVAYPKPKFRETTQQLDLAEIGDWKSCTHDYVYSSCSYETALDWELVLDGKGKGSGQKECLSRVKYRFRKGIRPRRYPRYMYLTKDLGIFLGMWCAEGVADSFGRIGTAHHIDEKGIVESIYRRLGFNPNIYRRSGKGIYAEIHSKPLALFLKYVCRGKDARSKEVNSEFVGYPEEFIKGFLEGLFFGDGSRFKDANRTVTSLRTSSWKLALQVRKLLLSFGMMSSIIWNAPSECDFLHESGQLQHIEGGESWTLKISGEAEDFYGCQWFSDDQFFYLRLRKIEEIDSQETYGFTTDTHTFCAVGVATHNTGGSGGTLMEGEMRLPGPGYERLNRLHPDQYGQYGLLDRYSVLADVAPWSDEFRAYNQMVTRMAPNLPPEDQQFIQTIKDQVTEVKKRHNWFPYQYARQSFQTESVRVGHVVPGHPEMFVSSKDPDHPIRLAGVRSASTPQAQAFMENILQPGAKVEVTWDANQPSFSSSKEQTIDAIVKVNNMSVNQMLMNSPYAQPSRSTQPIDVKATTSALSYRFHAMIETLAHRNTLLNTKFWQRRTPIEDWERANIYGATFPQWNAPIQDFIKPMFYRSANRNPITAAAVLGFVGSMFGSNPRSKAALGVAGGMAGFFTSLFTNARTVQTGERFIPKYRQQQMAVEEDADVLNYVKYLSLYNRYRIAAAREEGQDPEELAEESEREGRSNKQKHVWDWEDAQVGDRPSLPESQKRYQPIGPLTAEALGFRRQMRRTMYGADPYTANIMDLSAAIPKRKRDYFMEFLNAPKSQRARILSTSPRLERRIYESRWGMQVEQRPNLNEYFSEHELPPPDWQGWSPDVSMDEVKIKVAEHMGLDLSQMGYFPQEIQEANLLNPTYPSYVIQPQSPTATTRALRQLLVGQAVGGRVQAVPTPWSGTQVQYQAGVA